MTAIETKLLIVDDRAENLMALGALLEAPDVQVIEARSGAEALEALLRHEVALALVDVQMPEMDGFELAELMRGTARTRNVPIIFVTAGPHDSQRAFKGYESGAVDFLWKPVDERILLSKVNVFLELHRQRQELAEALRLNELFVGILGHDLRTPLSVVTMTVDALLRAPDMPPKHHALMGRTRAAAERMSRLIHQLLDVTRVRLGRGLELQFSQVDVGGLVHRVIDEHRTSRPERTIELEVHGDTQVSADPDRLLQVFSNLVGNAITHGAPEAPVRVAVRADPGAPVVISVKNQGTIARERLPSIFDPFKASSSTGLGLGLFITHQIVEAHGGSIDLSSSPERGTEFLVRLPRRT